MSNAFSVDLSTVKPAAGNIKLAPVSSEMIAGFRHVIDDLANRVPVDLENHPSQQVYAEVKVGGKVVATLSNGGLCTMSNAMAARLANLPSMKNPQGSGPQLAQQRAEEIARALGGRVEKAETAMTPAEYARVPPIQFRTAYDAAARERAATGFLLQAQAAADAP